MLVLYELMRRTLARRGVQVAASGALGGLLGGLGGGDDDHVHRRRRRRRALTASDKADIAFVSGTLGKPAGRDFAMIVAART